jgi:hypothetical protein
MNMFLINGTLAFLGRGQESHRLPLAERFVVPDIEENQHIPAASSEAAGGEEKEQQRVWETVDSSDPRGRSTLRIDAQKRPTRIRQRTPCDEWLGRSPQQVIRGEPGAGKSTLLRYIALDLLRPEPTMRRIARRWGEHLPVWVPFPFWTQQIASGNNLTSFKDILRSWFHQFDQDDLWSFVEQALEDQRLLLLVDGLDEWRDEVAAQTALDQLVVFVRDRRVPALLVSRPHGYDRLRGGIPGWPVCTLAPLSTEQQEQLAQIWYRADAHRHAGNKSKEEIAKSAAVRSNEFRRELETETHLAELAGVPLLLGLLIRLSLEQQQLPRNRFAAYEAMIDLLLEYHPIHRRKAARLAGTSTTSSANAADRLSIDDIKEVFADLAWRMQTDQPEGLVSSDVARHWIEDYAGASHGLGLSQPDARAVASGLIGLGATEYGLLVNKSPSEIGFFHRTCQETLAARRLRSLEVTQQLQTLVGRAGDVLWREVLLAFIHRAEKPFLRDAILQLQDAYKSADISSQLNIESLLAEIGFSEARLFPDDQKGLIAQTFKQIHRGDYVPHKEHLMRVVCGALGAESRPPREAVRSQIHKWFPCRMRYRAGPLGAIGKWSRTPETDTILIDNLHDEEASNCYAAASALAECAAGDTDMAKELKSLARHSCNRMTRASALKALLKGWPIDEDILKLAHLNRECGAPEPTLVAVDILIQKGLQTEAEKNSILKITKDFRWYELSLASRIDLPLTLIRGWPRDSEIRSAALEGGDKPAWTRGVMDHEASFQILFVGYPNDDAAAEVIIKQFQKGFHLYAYYFGGPDKLLEYSRAWQSHQKLRDDFENLFLSERDRLAFHQIDFLGACPTPKIRDTIIEMLKQRQGVTGFAIQALLRVWGCADSQVAAALKEFVEAHSSQCWEAREFVTLLPIDPVAMRKQLVAELSHASEPHDEWILTALRTLDQDLNADDIITAALKLDLSKRQLHRGAAAELIAHGRRDPRIRKLAIDLLQSHDAPFEAISIGFENDNELRQEVLRNCHTLPITLSEILVEHLDRMSLDDDYSLNLLQRFDDEGYESVKIPAAVALARRLSRREVSDQGKVCHFTKLLTVVGYDYEGRRQAALAALIVLNKFELIADKDQERVIRDLFSSWVDRDRRFQMVVANHWGQLETFVGVAKLEEIVSKYFDERALGLLVSRFPSTSPLLRWLWRRHLKRSGLQVSDTGQLDLMAKMMPGAGSVRENCLQLISNGFLVTIRRHVQRSMRRFCLPTISRTMFRCPML